MAIPCGICGFPADVNGACPLCGSPIPLQEATVGEIQQSSIKLELSAEVVKELLRDLAFSNAGYGMTAILGYVGCPTEVGKLYNNLLDEVRKADPKFNPLS